jgi:hypothetical protein
VLDGVVYVAGGGEEASCAVISVNGVGQILNSPSNKASAYSVAVKK